MKEREINVVLASNIVYKHDYQRHRIIGEDTKNSDKDATLLPELRSLSVFKIVKGLVNIDGKIFPVGTR